MLLPLKRGLSYITFLSVRLKFNLSPIQTFFMKVSGKVFAALVVGLLLSAFVRLQTGSIKGMVSPADGAVRAWAESSTDTLKADIVSGSFEITNVKPGTYKVIIEAKPPYRNASKDNIEVSDGKATDAGEIKLEK